MLFHPVEWLPAIAEALLWQENGMDLGPLTRSSAAPARSWELRIAGPGSASLSALRGTTIRQHSPPSCSTPPFAPSLPSARTADRIRPADCGPAATPEGYEPCDAFCGVLTLCVAALFVAAVVDTIDRG